MVCTDYFTKWVETEPLANIRDVDVKRFIWKSIVTRFGVPIVLISDNDLQFDSKAFRKYYSDLGIKNKYSTPAYPQGNGQAEAVNKVIVNGLRRGWMTPREDGLRSYHTCFGPTGQRLGSLLERPPSQ